MKNLLITGGSGFVGRNMREALGDKYNIYAPRHKELDAADSTAVEKYISENKIDLVLHGAVHVARFNGSEELLLKDMLMSAAMEKASHTVERVVYFGSGAEFDKRYDITMVSEDDFGKSVPANDYGIAKYTMNQIARASENIYNMRLFGIFGKYELWDCKFLSNLCCKAVFGLPLTVRRECSFDFLDIADLACPVEAALEGRLPRHDYNTSSGKAYDLSVLAAMINEISGKKLPLTILSEGRNNDYTSSNEKLRRDLPEWKITPMQKSLENLYRYYYDNQSLIDAEVLRETK